MTKDLFLSILLCGMQIAIVLNSFHINEIVPAWMTKLAQKIE